MAACLYGPVTFCGATGGKKGALKCQVRLVNEYNDCIPPFFSLPLLGGSTTSQDPPSPPLHFRTLCIIHNICSHYLSTNLLNYFYVLTPKGPGLWYHV